MANVVTTNQQGSVAAEAVALIVSIDSTDASDVFVPCGFTPSIVKATRLAGTTATVVEWNTAMGGKYLLVTGSALAFAAFTPFTVVEQSGVRGLLFDGTNFLGTQGNGVQIEIWR